jgi:hypothetical protein
MSVGVILYLLKKRTTLKQLFYDNCINRRIKRKKNIVIQMGNLSHTIEIKQ